MRHNIETKPVCKHCGKKPVTFLTYRQGFHSFCKGACYYHYTAINSMHEIGINDVEFRGRGLIRINNLCPKHPTFDISYNTYRNRLRAIDDKYKLIRLCPICYPERAAETTIETYIKSVLDKYNIKYVQHNRKILKGKELDFYLPSERIGIECNGVYWHSMEMLKDKDAHIKKHQKCKDMGINLLYFWEQDIHKHFGAIENIICMTLLMDNVTGSTENIYKFFEPNEEVQSFIKDFTFEDNPTVSPMNLTIGDSEKFHTVLGFTFINENEININYFYTRLFSIKKLLFSQCLTVLRVEQPEIKVLNAKINNEYQTGELYISNDFKESGFIEPKVYTYHLTSHQKFETDEEAYNTLGRDVKHLVHYKNLGWTLYKKEY